MRNEAIEILKKYEVIDEEYCSVEGIKVANDEKDRLLKQLINDEDYLKIPLSLLLSSPFWRGLKADSNTRCGLVKKDE